MAEIRIVSYLSDYDIRDVVLLGSPLISPAHCGLLAFFNICLLMPKHDLDLMFPTVSSL